MLTLRILKPTKLKIFLSFIVLILRYFFLVYQITSVYCDVLCNFNNIQKCDITNFSKIKILPNQCPYCGLPCIPFTEVFIEYLIVFTPPILTYLIVSLILYFRHKK